MCHAGMKFPLLNEEIFLIVSIDECHFVLVQCELS